MFDNLLKIYDGKIITDIKTFDQEKYYYFYNEHGQVFGIAKNLSSNEYQLIKSIYLEKTFYYNDVIAQNFHEYIFENRTFPLADYQKISFFIIKESTNEVMEQVFNLLKDVLGEIVVLKNRDYRIIFYFENTDYDLKDLFITLSDDFGVDFNVHLGFAFYRETAGSDIAKYIYSYMNSSRLTDQPFSTFVDLILQIPAETYHEILTIVKKNVLKNIDSQTVDLIQTLFKNNLNVSQTAKLSYLHRNSLLNRIDFIHKETGLNMQVFNDACVMNLLLNKSL
jgi:ribosomal protein L19